MHSTASDGSYTSKELLDKCATSGLDLCSITDHDCADAQESAIGYARKRGLSYLTGIEISVQHAGELHILGYGCDIGNPGYRAEMEELRAYRIDRTRQILAKLDKIGIHLTLADVERQAHGNTIGRPHVALALVENGHAANYQEAYDNYLNYGGLCYVNRRKLQAREAIDIIHDAGGTAVLAHPGLIATDDLRTEVRELVNFGLQGIEAFYPLHTDSLVSECLDYARDFDLLVTCGSDYHGPYRDGAIGKETRTDVLLEKSAGILMDRYVQ